MSLMNHEGEFDHHPIFYNGVQKMTCPICSNEVEIKRDEEENGRILYYACCSNPDCAIKSPMFSKKSDVLQWWNDTLQWLNGKSQF